MKFEKPKKINRSALKKKADIMFSHIIREAGVCQLAGLDKVRCGGNLQCMHILGRSNYVLRWDTVNALCGCAGHHTYYTMHPWEWNELIKAKFKDRYEYINQYRNDIWDKNYNRVIAELKGMDYEG